MMCRTTSLASTQQAFVGTTRSIRPQRRAAGAACRGRAAWLVTQDSLVLVPTGDGSSEHLEEAVEMPGMVELKDGSYTLGRANPSDIVIPIPTVSARHAQLDVDAGKLTVRDLESTNGTFIDERELEAGTETELSLGSEVIFGDTFLAKFVLEER